ncbi:Predicted membrane protein [Butyrivibrio fibrisolvens 16/4]|nr:Predicted membrane protein [Butyrivibrio fibrisolvens 16/4]
MEFFINLMLVFFTFSFVGWCIEVTLKYRQFGRFINRGFLIGPWLPIYGAGAALITLTVAGLTPVEKGIGTTFAISLIVCGLIEYVASYFMEMRFHARWWDYSQKPMNLNGRVWIGNLILFGLGGVAIIHIVNPVLYGFFEQLSLFSKEIIAGCLSAIILADYSVSHFVLKLVKIGVESSEADNTEAISKDVRLLLSNRSIFYRRFADAYPDVIYRTEKVKARMEEIRLETEKFRIEAEKRIDELNQQYEKNKAEWDASIKAGREQLRENLEPTSFIKNSLIEKQNQLIELLYDESTAPVPAKVLMDEIEHERLRLEKRSW